MVAACRPWHGSSEWGDQAVACVGDLELHRAGWVGEIVRDGDGFRYRGETLPEALVAAVQRPLVGALPDGGQCGEATRPIQIQLHEQAWTSLVPTLEACASTPRVLEIGGDEPTANGLAAPLFELLVAIAAIDGTLDRVGQEPAPDMPPSCESTARTPAPLVHGQIDIWSWRGPQPLELAAQATATAATTAQVAAIAGELRTHLPGITFTDVAIYCRAERDPECRRLDVSVGARWAGIPMWIEDVIVDGEASLGTVRATWELLTSRWVMTLLDIGNAPEIIVMAFDDEDPHVYVSIDTDEILLEHRAGSQSVALTWSASRSDDLTRAFDRSDRWATAVGLADAEPLAHARGRTRAWIDLDGRRIAAPAQW